MACVVRWVAAMVLGFCALQAQLITGKLEGTVHSDAGVPVAGTPLTVTAINGFTATLHADGNGLFSVALPYGQYELSGISVFIRALQTTRVDVSVDAAGSIRALKTRASETGIWHDETHGRLYPEPFSLAGALLSREPSTVTEPLDFAGLSDNRLAVMSSRAFSWTSTQFRFMGMDATDSYQPGRPVVLPDVQALDEVVVRRDFAQTASASYGTEVSLFMAQPRGGWHGALASDNTGSALSATNLPQVASRGLVQQADRFNWFTRDQLEVGGPLGKRADMYASGTGQYASQTEPLLSPGNNQNSRLLFGNARGRVRARSGDQFDALYSGSRINLSGGGMPAGIESLGSNRMEPSFVLPGGFAGQREVDHLDFLQLGWTHLASTEWRLGTLELRYGYSVAHFDTPINNFGSSSVELLGGEVTGEAPLGSMASRTRQSIETVWQPLDVRARGTTHGLLIGGGWKSSRARNRFETPSNRNLITANGVPAYVVEFTTPIDAREQLRSGDVYVADHVTIARSISVELGVLGDFSRGSVPAQQGEAARPDLISWNEVSPRAAFAWAVPNSHGLVLRGAYFRLYAPLAGRYLDFGNPSSLGGTVYLANGTLVSRFGGPFSSISPTLRRPYSDEFDVSAEVRIRPRTMARVHLFRRDEKDRIAAVNTGVPASAFTAVSVTDPGPDGIADTFDDQRLVVYAQNPATFGQDKYSLTNPAGLRMQYTGLVAEAATEWKTLTLHASFVAEKSYGPTNPGDTVNANDPGVIGTLFMDPNTTIHAAGRDFVDRAYVGKVQMTYGLPRAWGGLELASVANYLDGLVFARQLLITGLPQGPLLVATTVRGSPEGGNRAQYAVNWNLRISRPFQLPIGRLMVAADLFNVMNAGQWLQENDLSGPAFNQRLPVAIQPPRFLRVGFRYDF